MSEDDQKNPASHREAEIKASARRDYTQHAELSKNPKPKASLSTRLFNGLGSLLADLFEWVVRLPSTKLGLGIAVLWVCMGLLSMMAHLFSWKEAADRLLSYQIWEKVFMYSVYGAGAIFTFGGFLLVMFLWDSGKGGDE